MGEGEGVIVIWVLRCQGVEVHELPGQAGHVVVGERGHVELQHLHVLSQDVRRGAGLGEGRGDTAGVRGDM